MIFLLIAIGIVTLGLLIFLVKSHRANAETETEATAKPDPNVECCGAHEVCEAETLLTLSEEIIYYSDEELDEYRNMAAEAYSPEQIEEFRDILLTLQQHEVTGWLKSLRLRDINLPGTIREEALMIVDEFRQKRMETRRDKENNKQ